MIERPPQQHTVQERFIGIHHKNHVSSQLRGDFFSGGV